MKAIHQFVAGLNKIDGITNEAFVMQKIFRLWECRSEIFSEDKLISPALVNDAHDFNKYSDIRHDSDIALLHLSNGSPVNIYFKSLNCLKVILYHNITPPCYFNIINNKISCSLTAGYDQAKSLAQSASINIADSSFSAGELAKLGYKDVKVLPLILNLGNLYQAPDKRMINEYKYDKTNILFVGRCSPNKKIEDVISAFTYFNNFVCPESRLILAGSTEGMDKYFNLLVAQARNLSKDNIIFTGPVTQPQLIALYKCADIFLCMSEHEGFCIPIIESMVHDVPVLAYSAAAVPETMDGAGILFKDKNFELIAEMMGKLINDSTFRTAILRKQRERVERFTARNLEAELKELLKPLLSL